MAGEGYDARLVTELGEVPRQGTFRDTLLDTLAVIRPSRESGLGTGIEALSAAGGQIVAVLGLLSAAQARQLAAARRGTAPGLALLLVPRERDWSRQSAACAEMLIAAGWRVATVPDAARLAPAWQELHQASPTVLAGVAAAVAGAGEAGAGEAGAGDPEPEG